MKTIISIYLVLVALFYQLSAVSYAQTDSLRHAQLMEKIKKLELERANWYEKNKQKQVTEDSIRQTRALNLSKYQMVYDSCSSGMIKSEGCRDALRNLAEYYYEKSINEYAEQRDAYEKKMTECDKDSSLPVPVNPVPDYSKPIELYTAYIEKYPDSPEILDFYLKLYSMYLLTGEMCLSDKYHDLIIEKFPGYAKSKRMVPSKPEVQLKYYLNMQEGNCRGPAECEYRHYRIGELYYELGKPKKAKSVFKFIVNQCENGEFLSTDNCKMAEDFLKFIEKRSNP